MNHENMRRLVNLEKNVKALEARIIRLEAGIRARLKEEAEAREVRL